MSVPGSVGEVRAAAIEVLHGTATIIEVIGMGVIVAGSVVAADIIGTVVITPSRQDQDVVS